ncbi:MAG: sulfite exporter TauE/SafE family protein [Clostridiales bacterium]|nr:sulfite exporter TauE/SafE family protein [Clostridiales bacterium]
MSSICNYFASNAAKLFMMKKRVRNLIMIAGGLGVGFANGFFGGGGGMLCVPLLDKVLKEQTKVAHATAMLIILPISIASAITYVVSGYFDLRLTLIVGGGVVAGGIAGALLLKKLRSGVVAVIFAVLMIAAGVRLAFF